MRGPVFFCTTFLLFGLALSSFGQMTNQSSQTELPASINAAPGAATMESVGPRPLPSLIVGDKTFENVTLTGFDGKIVVVSHAYGVKNIPVEELTPDQIDALNRTSEKFKVTLPSALPPAAPATNAPPSTSATGMSRPSPAVQTNGPSPAAVMSGQSSTVVATNAVTQVPVENPALVAQAAARTEAMIQDLKTVGRSENESEPEEDVPVRVPGVVRFLIWASCFTVSVLLIIFLTVGFLRRRAQKSVS